MRISSLVLHVLALTALLFSTGCKNALPLSWTDTPVIIDGNPQDWQNYPSSYDEKLDASFSIVNDGSMLFILMKCRKSSPAARMGISFWLNDENEREEKLGIKYRGPGAVSAPNPNSANMRNDEFDRPERESGNRRNNPFSDPKNMNKVQVRNGKQLRPIMVDPDGRHGIIAAKSVRKDVVVYELAINLQNEDFDFPFNTQPGEKIYIGIESMPDISKMMRGRGGRGGGRPGGTGGGMSSPPPGGMGGGPGGRRGGGISERMNPEIEWIQIQLAENQ